jgi:hypothetical protein
MVVLLHAIIIEAQTGFSVCVCVHGVQTSESQRINAFNAFFAVAFMGHLAAGHRPGCSHAAGI